MALATLVSSANLLGFEPAILANVGGLYVRPDGSSVEPGSKRRPLFKVLDKFLSGKWPERCLLLLGEVGSGKTSLLLHYFQAHEARGAAKRMPLTVVALGQPRAPEQIAGVPEDERGKRILFLDGLDEWSTTKNEPKERLAEVLRLSEGYRRVVITARTELFDSIEAIETSGEAVEVAQEDGETKAAPQPQIRPFFLLPLNKQQVERYLKKRFSIWQSSRRRAMRGLMVRTARTSAAQRPLLLAHAEVLAATKSPLRDISEAFETIVTVWLEREKGSAPDVLLAWAKQLALHAFREIARGRWGRVGAEDAARYAQDLALETPALERGSLLLQSEDGSYGFVHTSLLEYLFVLAFCHMSTDERRTWLQPEPIGWTPLAMQFARGEAGYPESNLSYADLTGADFSGVDLTGACLGQACLVSTNLEKARLAVADLKGANLEGANLVGAYLRGADLTGARLVGADLTGADLSEAVLHSADLRGASLRDANLAGTELATARVDDETLQSLAPAGFACQGSVARDPATGMRFVWIPGGRFKMGRDGESRETSPAHWVRLSSFWLGETPVTNKQYALFIQHAGHASPSHWIEPRFGHPEQPTVGVTHDDALAFCDWLRQVTGLDATLPSEAQWEFAARGTDGRQYPWGNTAPDPSLACYAEDAMSGRPAKVGSFPPGKGPHGTLDQAGNVWEWCLDAWNPNAYVARGSLVPLDPVVGEGQTDMKLVRGGSWFFPEEDLTTTARGKNKADATADDLGFRVAIRCVPAPEPARAAEPEGEGALAQAAEARDDDAKAEGARS